MCGDGKRRKSTKTSRIGFDFVSSAFAPQTRGICFPGDIQSSALSTLLDSTKKGCVTMGVDDENVVIKVFPRKVVDMVAEQRGWNLGACLCVRPFSLGTLLVWNSSTMTTFLCPLCRFHAQTPSR